MASHELLKASEEEIKGRILSRLCGRMSPDELFSPGTCPQVASINVAWETEETLERERKEKLKYYLRSPSLFPIMSFSL